MATRKWTSADIEAKGLKVSNSTTLKPPKSVELKTKQVPASFALGRLKEGEMNKTEAAYSQLLELRKRKGFVQVGE